MIGTLVKPAVQVVRLYWIHQKLEDHKMLQLTLGLHLVWWTLIGVTFWNGWTTGGVLGYGIALTALLAPVAYTPTPDGLFTFYVLWVTPITNYWKNRPTYTHFGLVVDENFARITEPGPKGKTNRNSNHYWFRSTTFVRDGEPIIVASLDDEFINQRLPCNEMQTILPPDVFDITWSATNGDLVFPLNKQMQSLLLGGKATVKLALLTALHDSAMYQFSREWDVTAEYSDRVKTVKLDFKRDADWPFP
jgi:hypothetical protein